MDIDGHDIVSMLFIVSAYVLGLPSMLGPLINQLIFFLSFILFSTRLNPDIDLKLPFIGHRGITHNYKGIILVASILILFFLIGLPYLGFKVSSNLIIPIILGAAFGWLLHTITDWLYDRIHNFSWIVIVILVVVVGFLVNKI